jgi:hypothetical protein
MIDVDSGRQVKLGKFRYLKYLLPAVRIVSLTQSCRVSQARNEKYQLWKHDSHPIELSSPAFTQQKIDYIPACLPAGRHQNPVEAGLVYRAEDYIYSSASNYAGLDQIIASHEQLPFGLRKIVRIFTTM